MGEKMKKKRSKLFEIFQDKSEKKEAFAEMQKSIREEIEKAEKNILRQDRLLKITCAIIIQGGTHGHIDGDTDPTDTIHLAERYVGILEKTDL